MNVAQTSEKRSIDILFNWYYDGDSGGFYRTPSERSDRLHDPNLFSTIEALWAIFQSPLNDDDHQKLQKSIQYVCDELAEYNDLLPANPEIDNFAFEHSVISVSYSLLILTRARKYARQQLTGTGLQVRLDELIRTHLEFVCDAQYEDNGGWSIVPPSNLDQNQLSFNPEIYCTSIALMALQSCEIEDYKSIKYNKNSMMRAIANGLGALVNLGKVPNPSLEDTETGLVGKETYEEATLVATWMLSLTRIIWDRNLWSEDWENPTQFDEFNDKLSQASEFIKSVTKYEQDLGSNSELRLVEFNYAHEISYPYSATNGQIRKESFSFQLPGSAAVPALVLSPFASVRSEECQYLKRGLENILKEQQNQLIMSNNPSIPIYELTGKIVSLTYFDAAKQGITMIMRHFIQWGEVPKTVRDGYVSSINYDEGTSKQTESDGPLTQLGRAGDSAFHNAKQRLSAAFGKLLYNPRFQVVISIAAMGLLSLLGIASGWTQNTIFLSMSLIGIPATVLIVYSFSYQKGLSAIQSSVISLIPPLVLAALASLFLVESQTAVVGATLITEVITVCITFVQILEER